MNTTARRFYVVGCSGSGKSTLARRLAAAKGLVHIELDGINHLPDWQECPTEEFRESLRLRIAHAEADSGGWVIDGNYVARVGDLVLDSTDCVVWLDFPRRLVMRRLVLRTLRRALIRQVLWNGNREPWTNLVSFDPSKSIIAWAWTTHPVCVERYSTISERRPDLQWIRLRRPGDADRILT